MPKSSVTVPKSGFNAFAPTAKDMVFEFQKSSREHSIRNQALPDKLCCAGCNKYKSTNNFSKKQLAELQYKLRLNKCTSTVRQIKCIPCTGLQRTELKCCICDAVKPLDLFAKTHRKTPDAAKCYTCMAAVQGVAPDDRATSYYRGPEDEPLHGDYEDDDATETSSISNVWEMDDNNEYALDSETDGGVAVGSSTVPSSATSTVSSATGSGWAPSVAGISSLSGRLAGVKLTSANLNSLNQRSAGEAAQPAPAAQGLNNPYEDEDDEDDEGMVHPHAKLPPHRRGNFFAEAGAAAKGVAGRSTASQSVTGSSLGGVKENKSASSAAFRAPPSLSSAENWATVRGAASNARAAPSSGTAGPAIGYTGYTPAGMPVQMHRAPSTTAGSNFGDTKTNARQPAVGSRFPKVRPSQFVAPKPKMPEPDQGHRVLRLEEDSSSDEEDAGGDAGNNSNSGGGTGFTGSFKDPYENDGEDEY